ARGYLEAASRNARPAVYVQRATSAYMADGRHRRVAVASGGAGGPAHRTDGRAFPPESRRGGAAPSELEADPRSSRPAQRAPAESGAMGESPGGAGACEISQRRHEGHGRAELLRSA